jgi:hypothetical protein
MERSGLRERRTRSRVDAVAVAVEKRLDDRPFPAADLAVGEAL